MSPKLRLSDLTFAVAVFSDRTDRAGSRGEFREEDELCCAWIAAGLISQGYLAEDEKTSNSIRRWCSEPADVIRNGKSAAYLARSGQHKDLEFVLSHINDLNSIYRLENDRIVEHTYASYPQGAPYGEKQQNYSNVPL